MPRIPKLTPKKRYRIDPYYSHAAAVCQVPCLVIQKQNMPNGDWWDTVHVIGNPAEKSTQKTARQIIAALKAVSA